MIVQELVSLGSLLNYLIDNSNKINSNFELKIWASQIACGRLQSLLFRILIILSFQRCAAEKNTNT